MNSSFFVLNTFLLQVPDEPKVGSLCLVHYEENGEDNCYHAVITQLVRGRSFHYFQ